MEGKAILKLKDLAGGDDGTRTRDLMRDRSTASTLVLQYLFFSHWLTPFQGICFRSKLIPFPAN